MECIYLDHNATTPCAPEVIAAMLPYFASDYANAGSPHAMGRAAANAASCAREQVAQLADCEPDQIIFTSGATESNNLVLLGVAATAPTRRQILTTSIEHASVLAPCECLREMGFSVHELPVDRSGALDLNALEEAINKDTLLVSVQAANNETGTLQPLGAVVNLAREHGALVHSDCAQMLGKLPISMNDIDVDYASFSGHKIYGPKGIGSLYVRDSRSRSLISPLYVGGGQEGGLRPGTMNIPGVVGFGAACHLASLRLEEEAARLTHLRDAFERQLRNHLPDISVNGAIQSRLPGTSNLTIPGVPASALIARAQGVCISDGSACSSGAPSSSHVLLAMGMSAEDADSTIRVSVGRDTSPVDVSRAVKLIVDTVGELRALFETSV